MQLKLTHISNTRFSKTFENVQTFLLDEESASFFWKKHVTKSGTHFFDNQFYHPILSEGKRSSIGRWIEDYNNDRSERVEKLLKSEFSWQEQNSVYFCISKTYILQTSWFEFTSNWMQFLEFESDSPILLNLEKENDIISFSALGLIFKHKPRES